MRKYKYRLNDATFYLLGFLFLIFSIYLLNGWEKFSGNEVLTVFLILAGIIVLGTFFRIKDRELVIDEESFKIGPLFHGEGRSISYDNILVVLRPNFPYSNIFVVRRSLPFITIIYGSMIENIEGKEIYNILDSKVKAKRFKHNIL